MLGEDSRLENSERLSAGTCLNDIYWKSRSKEGGGHFIKIRHFLFNAIRLNFNIQKTGPKNMLLFPCSALRTLKVIPKSVFD